LEVVLALALFVAAATVITSGLNASVREVERLRLNVHASNLAVTILSEIQMGLRKVESAGPEPFAAPYETWTWQVVASPLTDTWESDFQVLNVEVIVRHQLQPVVRRLAQFLPATTSPASAEWPTTAPPEPGSD
jgi:HAMP domain-containing protein